MTLDTNLNQPLNLTATPSAFSPALSPWHEGSDRTSWNRRGAGSSALMDQAESWATPEESAGNHIALGSNSWSSNSWNADSLSVPNPTRFNATYGYGAVDAAAAVARAIGQPRFWDVPDLGSFDQPNDQVFAPEVWNRGFTGQNVIVAVLDTGVDYTHFDLSNNIWINSDDIFGNGIDDDNNGYIDDIVGWDFHDDDYSPLDTDKHGTHVAGTIAASNNGIGTTGVAHNAKIMPVRVLGDRGGSNTNVAMGIRYAADNGAHVINLSLGGGYSQEIEQAIEYASLRGSFVVMAAGNDSLPEPGHPARYASDRGVAVGAVDAWGQIADFSNRAGYDWNVRYVVAPGVGIYSTMPGHLYDKLDGTSMAAPHVSGVVALMLSANPGLTIDEIRSILVDTAIGHSSYSGDASNPLELNPVFFNPLLEPELAAVDGFVDGFVDGSYEFSVAEWVDLGMPTELAANLTTTLPELGEWSDRITWSDRGSLEPSVMPTLTVNWAGLADAIELL